MCKTILLCGIRMFMIITIIMIISNSVRKQ